MDFRRHGQPPGAGHWGPVLFVAAAMAAAMAAAYVVMAEPGWQGRESGLSGAATRPLLMPPLPRL
jgi:hypothetical protein